MHKFRCVKIAGFLIVSISFYNPKFPFLLLYWTFHFQDSGCHSVSPCQPIYQRDMSAVASIKLPLKHLLSSSSPLLESWWVFSDPTSMWGCESLMSLCVILSA